MFTHLAAMRSIRIAIVGILAAAPVAAQSKQPIVFQHGFVSSGATWENTHNAVVSELHVDPHLTTTHWYLRLWDQRDNLNTYFATHSLPDTTIIAGHSNGGLIGRAVAAGRALKALITIGTPHTGAPAVNNVAMAVNWGLLTWDYAESVRATYWSYEYYEGDQPEKMAGISGAVEQKGLSGVIVAAAQLFEFVEGTGEPVVVTTDMGPNSGFIGYLASTLGQQSANVGLRIGIGTWVSNWYNYMIFEGLRPNWATEGSIITDGAILLQANAYDFYRYYEDFGDPDRVSKQQNASMWLQSYMWLADLDVMWCGVIGAQTPEWMCTPSDGIVPIERQQFPGTINEGFPGFSHQQQKTSAMFQSRLVFWLRNNDHVKDRLTVSYTQPYSISSPGDYTFTANTVAANGNSVALEWFTSPDGTNFSSTGNTSSQQTLNLTWNQVIWLRLVGTADGLNVPYTVRILGPETNPTASISGSTHVRPNVSCTWTVSTSLPSPTGYQWYANGVPIGSNSPVLTYAGAGDFELSVVVSNSYTNAQGSVQIYVNPSHGPCLD